MVMSKSSQVGIVTDQFPCQCRHKNVRSTRRLVCGKNVSALMSHRIRHCVECPKCLTRYLIAFSPYRNGSYLVPTVVGCSEEFILYCSCKRPSVVSRCRWSEVKACEVSRAAYARGYGTAEQIVQVNHQPREAWRFDITKYLDLKGEGRARNLR
jgi:hypothetical protein